MIVDKHKTIQEYLKNLSKYQCNFNIYNSSVVVVNITFPHGWTILESDDAEVRITQSETKTGEYFFYSDITVEFERLFKVIENIIEFNFDAINKKKLFTLKVDELVNLFDSNDLETLETLVFTFKKKKKVPKKRKEKVICLPAVIYNQETTKNDDIS